MERKQYNQLIDINYDEDYKTNTLDIYYPEIDKEVYPTIIHVHGGAFKKGDKQDHQLDAYFAFVEAGYALVSINYRLSGEAIFPANIIDTKKAIRYLRKNASNYQLDESKFVLVGGSAGGYVVDMVCTTCDTPALDVVDNSERQVSCGVQVGVSWFGPTQFAAMDEQIRSNHYGKDDHDDVDSPESLFMGKQITKLNNGYKLSAQPQSYVHKDMPPMLLQHGRKDRVVPWQQSQSFYDAAKQVGADIIFEILEEEDHGTEGFGSKENMERVVSFVNEKLDKKKR